jgi:putative MATE family efflux protein
MSGDTNKRQGVRDLTSGPIARTLLLFALPTLGANILQSLNGSINTVWIGRFLGENALAATSNANIIMFLMFSLGFGFAMAASIIVGQRVGARDLDGARRSMGTGIGLFLVASVLIAVIGWLAAPSLLRLLGTPASASAFALAYLRVIFLGMPPMFLGLMLQMGLRGTGDSITPLIAMIVGALLDAGLNPVFILGLGPAPRMGIAGSATATLVSSYSVLILLLVYIYARDLPIRLRGSELRYLLPNTKLLKVIVTKGVPMGLQMMVLTLSGFVMIGLVNQRGVDVTAAYGVAQQLWTYIQMPAMAVGTGVSAMAAQNIGARRWDRVDRITRAGVGLNIAITGFVVVAMLLFDRPVLGLFLGAESPAIAIARHIQLIVSWSFILFGLTMVLFATVRANGVVGMPLLILSAGVLVGRIGFATVMIPHGEDWLWWSFPFGSGLTLLMAVGYYRFGKWRDAHVLPTPAEAAVQTEAVQEPGGRLNPSADVAAQ